ncbi:MAG: SpoVA/SpoVAEb family sporulation membrane protein [Oscillospiraceae bacterium]|nr:SpoVA/SpoVAEb family sporulation membrane protein [Oscillospiraceae bacterium]
MANYASPPSPSLKNCFFAFLIGGLICTLGQFLVNIYLSMGLDLEHARAACSISLVVLTALLTAFRLFSKLAKLAGAGTLIPITGFANAMVSPAMEFKAEGFVMGVGAKMFAIAGPVLVFGISASVIYGIILWIIERVS